MSLQSILYNAVASAQHKTADDDQVLIQSLQQDRPTMVARFGSVEIKAILYPSLPSVARWLMKDKVLTTMSTNAGFFPAKVDSIYRFSTLMNEDIKSLDILGSWRIEEFAFRSALRQVQKVALKSLEPYFCQNPWTQALENKKVLVVHPLSTTIERQYHENREFIFRDTRVLPKFASLQTIKAVQTIAGQPSPFENWFAALDSMKRLIDACDFDVAIFGCGAYGFPLAAHVKRLGKKAVHLGGPTQILFGIRGKRWDNHPVISKFYNDHWVRPAPEDVPKNSTSVEGGCYW